MKKIFCILLSLLLLFTVCACKDGNNDKQDGTVSVGEITEDLNEIDYPSPLTTTWEKSENNLGARYSFSLKEFNDMLNKRCKELGNSELKEFFEYDNWQIMSEKLTDENGIEYISYYYSTDVLTITAAVECESNKVMNLGCGTSYEEFVNGDENYQYTVILTSAILAMTAGDYDKNDLEFLYYIFFDAAKYDKSFFYNNSIYMLNLSKEKGEQGAALLYMMSPCKDEILEAWELTDYKKFEDASVKTELIK